MYSFMFDALPEDGDCLKTMNLMKIHNHELHFTQIEKLRLKFSMNNEDS